MALQSPNRETDHGPVKVFRLRPEYVDGKPSLMAIQQDAQRMFDILCETQSSFAGR